MMAKNSHWLLCGIICGGMQSCPYIKATLHVGSQCNTQGSGAPIDSVIPATARDKF